MLAFAFIVVVEAVYITLLRVLKKCLEDKFPTSQNPIYFGKIFYLEAAYNIIYITQSWVLQKYLRGQVYNFTESTFSIAFFLNQCQK